MALTLFKLPMLVIKLILEIMGFVDIFVLTSTSSKSKRIVKNLVTKRDSEMQIFMEKSGFCFTFQQKPNQKPNSYFAEYISISGSGRGQSKKLFCLKIGAMDHVPAGFADKTDGSTALTIHENTNTNHGTELYNALNELFGTPCWSFRMDLTGVASETHRSWINWINETLSPPSIMVVVGKCSFLDYVWLLGNVKTKEEVALKVEPTDYSDNVEVDFTFKAERNNIHDGRWIKLKHLESMEAKILNIDRLSLTDPKINTFLRDWKNLKEASNLKSLTILFYREADLEVVLEGMEATDEDRIKPANALKQRSFEMANGDKCTVIYAKYRGDNRFGFEFRVGT